MQGSARWADAQRATPSFAVGNAAVETALDAPIPSALARYDSPAAARRPRTAAAAPTNPVDDALDQNGITQTLLSAAVGGNNTAVSRLLLETYKAEVDLLPAVRPLLGGAPLHLAVAGGNVTKPVDATEVDDIGGIR